MKVERAVGLLSVSLIIVSTIAYWLNNPNYGFILAVAIPLAIVSVYLEVRQKEQNRRKSCGGVDEKNRDKKDTLY